MSDTQTDSQQAVKWRPLPAHQRRVAGVLVEKAKTTPDAYPLSLNALTNGCNQKSNRSPQMQLEPDAVEDALSALRQCGAVSEVQGDGRVPRYRHYLKDWLGVEGAELAVMAELLLRGTQTVGELRGRAARMASGQLPDVAALRPVVQSLIDKQLVVALSPAGRGQLVTHNLFLPDEMDRVKTKAAASAEGEAPAPASSSSGPVVASSPTSAVEAGEIGELRKEVTELREKISRLQEEVDDIWSNIR